MSGMKVCRCAEVAEIRSLRRSVTHEHHRGGWLRSVRRVRHITAASIATYVALREPEAATAETALEAAS